MLFLDFDGVRHPENGYMTRRGPRLVSMPGHRIFEHAALPGELSILYPSVRVVLSTSWVCAYRSVRRVARRLPSTHVRVSLGQLDTQP